ncbi:hypothetical protein [Halioxenophilus aromaticivorans]|uniref:hypothetical protein n=1 Tax=Halioxenophilus aromaticivorans TaxID=1306992 RepID=UPI0031EBA575
MREDGDVYYRQDGLLDSMSTLKFMVAIQKQYDMVFSPEQFNSQATATLRQLSQAIAAALATSD